MNTLSPSAFAEFHGLVLGDPALFARLQAESDPAAFVAVAVGMGAEHGLVFGATDVQAALNAARRAWQERNVP